MVGVLSVSGCGEDVGEVDEQVGEVRQAVFATPSGFNFSRNGVSVAEPRQSNAQVDAAMRVGYGVDPHSVVTYQYTLATDGRRPWARLQQSAMLAKERPSRVWLVPPTAAAQMTVIGTNLFTDLTFDTVLGGMFPTTQMQGLRPVGPIATLSTDTSKVVGGKSGNTAFALMSDSNGNLSMHHGYLPNDAWSDAPLNLGGGPAACGSGKTPYTSPHAVRRKVVSGNFAASQDSLVYGCGSSSPAQACEYRNGGPASGQTFTVCFGAGSSFVQGTRPVAFADAGRFSTTIDFGTGQRWVFAAVNVGNQRKILAQRETSSVDSANQPTYEIETIDTQPNTTVLSSPMPVMYKNQSNVTTLSAFYLRKVGNANTKLVEAKTTDFDNWTVTEILDTGANIPGSNEPTPHYQAEISGMPDQLRVQFRLPLGASTTEVRDTVEVIRQPDGTYLKTILPPAYDTTNLYVIQDSSATLYRVDESTGVRTAVGTGWSGVTAFATDGIALGYAVKGADLWEINLNDNSSRKLGSESWTGTTNLVFGYNQSFGAGNDSFPRLWAVRSNALRRVDLATGVSTSVSSFPGGVKLSAAYHNPNANALQPTLYVINSAGTLFMVNSVTGNQIQISQIGEWAQARAITTNPSTGHLYIAYGVEGVNTHRLYRLDLGGTFLGQSSTFSNAMWAATVNGTSYLMRSRRVMRIGGTGSSVTLTSVGDLWEDYTITGMVGRNH